MTHLKREMEKRGVTTYGILKYLKEKNKHVNIFGSHTHLNKKINGKAQIAQDELEKICQTIGELSGVPLNSQELESEVAVYTLLMK